jgi:hypothetical protein
MSLSNASIPIGATYTPSGGSATSFVSLGSTLESNKLFIDDSPADLLLRKTVLATNKAPTANASAPNGYTQNRSSLVFHVPMLLDNGNYTTNSVKIEVSYDPEADSTERAYLRELIAHVGVDADFDSLFDDASVA